MEPTLGTGSHGTGAQGADWVVDTDQNTFTKDVIEASVQQPVIVDFHSPSQQGSRQLSTSLENAVRAQKGAVKLARLNIESNAMLAQQLQVQPATVYAFYQGRPLDGFQGPQQDATVRQFVEQIVQLAGGQPAQQGPSVDELLEQGNQALQQGDTAAAQAAYAQVLEQEEENAAAMAGMLRCYLAEDDVAGAREVFDALTDAMKAKPEIESARAAIELAEQSAGADSDTQALERRVAADPTDHQARYDLAMAYNAADQREAAAEQLLEIVRRDRAWGEDAAKEQLVKFFEAWGPQDPVTRGARRKLSSILFA